MTSTQEGYSTPAIANVAHLTCKGVMMYIQQYSNNTLTGHSLGTFVLLSKQACSSEEDNLNSLLLAG